MNIIRNSYIFARDAHKGQVRKYTNEPYIVHPVKVSRIVNKVCSNSYILASCLLHDVVEDTDVTITDIGREFGEYVMSLVSDLTDVSVLSDGNRKIRKEIDRHHTAKACPEAKTIKIADMIDNMTSIVKHDPKFAKTYMSEKYLLLEVLTDGDPYLFSIAKNIIDVYYKKIITL